MTKLHVQFADSTEADIVAFFGAAQDPDVYEFLGEVESSDKRWQDYFSRQVPFIQQYLPKPTEVELDGVEGSAED